MLSNTLRLNLNYLKIIHILHPRYRTKTIGPILKNEHNSKRALTHVITQLISVNMKMKMKNRSHGYDIKRPKKHGLNMDKHNKYKKRVSMMMLICIKGYLRYKTIAS